MENRNWLTAACAVLGLLTSITAARADLYTYSLDATPGYGGGSLTGTISFLGSPGDPVPSLVASPAFSLTYTPLSGPTLNWTQSDSVAAAYNEPADFGTATLGDPVLTALTTPNTNSWVATDSFSNTIFMFWSVAGPGWEANGSYDYVYGPWSLVLQSDIAPEPSRGLAGIAMLAGFACVRSRRCVLSTAKCG